MVIINDPRHTECSNLTQARWRRNIYAIMNTMCPPGYHHNSSVATHALGHTMYNVQLPQSHCGC